jgi:DnaJ-class molecular chaperone
MKLKRCEKCKGRGGRYYSGSPGMWFPCYPCNGTGRVLPTQQSKSGEGR